MLFQLNFCRDCGRRGAIRNDGAMRELSPARPKGAAIDRYEDSYHDVEGDFPAGARSGAPSRRLGR
ncbi:hypothetical protein BOSE62_160345 [Bosea sp. 62]|nr:hypothetical protein BOSE7B_10033 [Bosea sp. 7B]CAD5247610.1 hypothetical protein BOSE21B_10173 [Bosea sp. 21B]CAD5270093.1 hypothetical protein BOSE46_150165 [Bosea sp. 46]VVT50955.1 hypothetical protein BOS5A_110172 [Bosea sp. EC-HK365B]VXA94259.1 hypothetical protein BOSE127_10034 [Bosea sp. 127]VXB98045.1 hypothetical protein BOSE62_160345 [Bosea sp. 62]VXC04609.1 hypothetical protein BOSE29B_170157 [Bosea sp. 29B]VXC49530.1 hypothetical protein BOSE125_230155 [Bosea sp. 125]